MQLQLGNSFDAGSGGNVGPQPTHTITVIQLGRIPGENRAVKAAVVFHRSLDLVGNLLGPPSSGDRKAKAILRAAVKQLLRHDDQTIDWLANIEDYLDLYEERTRGKVRGF